LLRNLHRRRKNFFFIDEVIVKQKKENGLLITTAVHKLVKTCTSYLDWQSLHEPNLRNAVSFSI